MYAYNNDGSLRWQFSTNGKVESSPVVGSDGTLYFGSRDYYIYALYPSGALKWKYWVNSQVSTSGYIGADGTLAFPVGSIMYAISTQPFLGAPRWMFTAEAAFKSSPAIDRDGTVYGGSDDGYVYAIDCNGKLKWRYPTGGNPSSPSLSADASTLFVSVYNKVFCAVDSSTGILRWKSMETDSYGVTPFSPTVDRDGTVYFGTSSGSFLAYSPEGNTIGGGTRHQASRVKL